MSFKQFLLREETVPDIEQLDQMLKSHDWYYSYSDDYRAWKRGSDEQEKILKLVKKLGKSGKDLYQKYIKKLGV